MSTGHHQQRALWLGGHINWHNRGNTSTRRRSQQWQSWWKSPQASSGSTRCFGSQQKGHIWLPCSTWIILAQWLGEQACRIKPNDTRRKRVWESSEKDTSIQDAARQGFSCTSSQQNTQANECVRFEEHANSSATTNRQGLLTRLRDTCSCDEPQGPIPFYAHQRPPKTSVDKPATMPLEEQPHTSRP